MTRAKCPITNGITVRLGLESLSDYKRNGCPISTGFSTGSGSRGKGGGKFYYYHCQRGCKTRFRADKAGEVFNKLLSGISIKKEVVNLYIEIIKDLIREKEGDVSSQKVNIEKRILENQNLLENAQDSYFSGDVDSITFNDVKKRYSAKINSLKRELTDLNVDEILLDTQIKYSFNLLKDLDFYYLNATSEFKRKILGSIFPENLIYSDEKYRTPNSDSVISLIANMAKVSEDSKTQKITNNGDQSPLARL